MLQRKVDRILAKLIDQLIPKRILRGDIDKFCKATRLGKTTLRGARSRQGIYADTLIKLLLAHGVSEELLTNLPRTKTSKISKTLTEWNKVGLSLSDKERENFMRFIEMVKTEWKLG